MFEDIIKESIEKQITNDDDQFYLFSKKDKNLWFKGYKAKSIYINQSIILKIKIRYYFDRAAKKYLYPVYEKYNIEKRFRIPFETRLNIARKVLIDKQTYLSAAKFNNKILVSKTTVKNYVNEFNQHFKYQVKLDSNINRYKNVFICIDDTFRNLKTENGTKKFRFRILNFYQLNKLQQTKNQIKVCIMYETNNADIDQQEHTLKIIENILNKYYQNLANKKEIVVCGDGAKYIDNVAKRLNAIQILDKFHCLNNIFKVFNFKSLNRNLSKENAIKINQIKLERYTLIKTLLLKSNFVEVYKILDNSSFLFDTKIKIVELNRLKKYLKKHESSIKNWTKFNINPTKTETYIQQIVKSNFGNVGKIFSVKIFKNILNTKCICY